ncbi:MAG: hypothetical protein WB723_11545 [Candidatus Acidiferrales bacterium]
MRPDLGSKKNLEGFLQDLICVVSSPEEVGTLVEILMALQLPVAREEPSTGTIRTKAARA